MNFNKKALLLYAVTDRSWVGKQTLSEQVESAIKGGVTCIQLREKNSDNASFLKEAFEIREICKMYNVPLIINDNLDIALKCNADGVHVGQTDMNAEAVREIVGNKMIIGVSARTVEQALSAEKAGADYLGAGAVFSTATKLNAKSITHGTLKEICSKVNIPVVAIGGINKNNISELADSGIDGVALVSAVFSADNIEDECRLLKKLALKVTAK